MTVQSPTVHRQTWGVLAVVLDRIDYTRDRPPPRRVDDPTGGLTILHTSDRFRLLADTASNYAVLHVFTFNPNTYRPGEMRHTRHEFVVPVATYHYEAWRRWVFDRIASIEHHETCESFQDVDDAACRHCGAHDDPDGDHTCPCPHADGDCPDHVGPWMTRPYAPHHGNGEDPYAFWPGGTPEQKAKAPGED